MVVALVTFRLLNERLAYQVIDSMPRLRDLQKPEGHATKRTHIAQQVIELMPRAFGEDSRRQLVPGYQLQPATSILGSQQPTATL